jgi:hypothetical protein
MTEHEMEDLLWEHSEKFLNEPLTQHRRQLRSSVGRSDLIFTDRIGRFLIIEIKLGKLKREAIGQLHDYYGTVKSEFPNRSVELMVIANHIPDERKIACETYNIEPREISERKFREIAAEVGYSFQSETRSTAAEVQADEPMAKEGAPAVKSDKQRYRLSVGGADTCTVDATGFLSRCDDAGKVILLCVIREAEGVIPEDEDYLESREWLFNALLL